LSNYANKKFLATVFERNGCIRIPLEKKQGKNQPVYKKGYEIRFVALNGKEQDEICNTLLAEGFSHGNAYTKGNLYIIPVYGYNQLIRFGKIAKTSKKFLDVAEYL